MLPWAVFLGCFPQIFELDVEIKKAARQFGLPETGTIAAS
jgi:hypothetical protein